TAMLFNSGSTQVFATVAATKTFATGKTAGPRASEPFNSNSPLVSVAEGVVVRGEAKPTTPTKLESPPTELLEPELEEEPDFESVLLHTEPLRAAPIQLGLPLQSVSPQSQNSPCRFSQMECTSRGTPGDASPGSTSTLIKEGGLATITGTLLSTLGLATCSTLTNSTGSNPFVTFSIDSLKSTG